VPGCRLFLLPCLLVLSGSGCGAAADESACTQAAALIGATPASAAAAAGLESDVGFLSIEADIETASSQVVRFRRICTVARIAPGRALTAAHCTEDLPSFRASVGFAAAVATTDDAPCAAEVGRDVGSPVVSARRGPGDLLVLEFEDANDRAGLPLGTVPPPVGQQVLLGGYGVAEDHAGAGVRRFAEGAVTGVADAVLTVQVVGGGACSGDSGGPMLRRDPAGRMEVIGILSQGSPSCRGEDEYMAVTSFSAWLRDGGVLPVP
jgi:hypothetical protein